MKQENSDNEIHQINKPEPAHLLSLTQGIAMQLRKCLDLSRTIDEYKPVESEYSSVQDIESRLSNNQLRFNVDESILAQPIVEM